MAHTQNCTVFKSNAFNTSIEQEYFLNPSCFGDDVAHWLMKELRARGYQTSERPDQEDFGWYFTFHAAGLKHNVVIVYRPAPVEGEGEWICWIERKVGLIGVVLARHKKAMPEAVKTIQDILISSQVISVIRFCQRRDA